MTIYVQVEKKDIISAASSGAVNGSLVALYICSIVFLLLGVAGLAGSMKGNSKKESKGTCLLALFSIGVMVFFLVFLAATIFFFVGPETIFGTDCTQGAKTDFVNTIYADSNTAYGLLCTDQCPCNSTIGQQLQTAIKNGNPNARFDGAAFKLDDCPAGTTDKLSKQSLDILTALQKLLNCGGWCSFASGKQNADPIAIKNDTSNIYYYRFRSMADCDTDGKDVIIQNAGKVWEIVMMNSRTL